MLIEELDFVKRKVDLNSIMTPDIKALVDVFDKHGFDIRLVGGAVRDLVLNKTPKDFDLATPATPDEMKEMFDAEGIKWIATGEKHGTLTALGPSTKEPFEITTLRVDSEHTGRHATVDFTRSWEDDATRRDLTYNAMSIDLKNGNLYDYFGGLEDLEAGHTKFVGDADERIKEDFLRILRLFRFAARYGHPIKDETKKAIARNAASLKHISGERIWMEVSKILSGENTVYALQTMQQTGVAKVIGLPIRDLNVLYDVKLRTNNPITILSTQLHDGSEVDVLRDNWKFSRPEKDLALFLVDNKHKQHTYEDLRKMVAFGASPDFVAELAKLQNVARVPNKINVPTFPVSGKDLISLGVTPGPEMGEILATLKRKWADSGFNLSRDDLLQSLNI